MLKTTVEIIPYCKIAYIRSIGPYGADNVQTMEKLKAWAREKSLLNNDSIILGIARDDPSVTKAEDCRYDSCIVVPDEYQVDEEYVYEGEIVGGKYVSFEIEHTAEAIQKAWADIFLELSKNLYKMDHSRPVIERYAAKMIADHKCEICIPITSI